MGKKKYDDSGFSTKGDFSQEETNAKLSVIVMLL